VCLSSHKEYELTLTCKERLSEVESRDPKHVGRTFVNPSLDKEKQNGFKMTYFNRLLQQIQQQREHYLEKSEASNKIRHVTTQRLQGRVRFGRPHTGNLDTKYNIWKMTQGLILKGLSRGILSYFGHAQNYL